MIDLRELFLENPELRRNWQIELSSKRVFTAGLITALFALIVLPSLLASSSRAVHQDIPMYLMIILWSQKVTLTLGGAISCWRAVRRERELNTFDFQRITRLSPLELAVGKLFGAPALAYFVTLCLALPAFFSAATSGSFAMGLLVRSYVLLFTGALVIHAFALMVSTISDKGGAVSGVVILLLLQVFPAIGWLAAISAMRNPQGFAGAAAVFRFYGMALPPTLLWALLELGFVAWFLLAVVRNIKLDVEAIQLFTVRQGLGFAAYCNFVWIGFYPWTSGNSGSATGLLLLWGVMLFYLVAIGVLQSRELVRRELREAGAAPAAAGKLLSPIVSLLGGVALTGLVIAVLSRQQYAGDARRGAQDFFLVLYFVAWLARDLFYLQWMKIRPVRSPSRKAFLYLLVFYVSTSIVFRSSFTSTLADSAAFSAWLAPFALLRSWTDIQWDAASGAWLLALLVQAAAAAAFAYLYLQQVAALAQVPKAAPPQSTPPRFSSTPA